jgi:hypothetical protein
MSNSAKLVVAATEIVGGELVICQGDALGPVVARFPRTAEGSARAHAIADTITAANAADEAFELAVRAAGYESRWDWNQHLVAGPEALRTAYRAKVTADNAMHLAFVKSREA